jgi:hypothetical protein
MKRAGPLVALAVIASCGGEPTPASHPSKPPSATTVTVTPVAANGPAPVWTATWKVPDPPETSLGTTPDAPPPASDADRVIARARPRFRACYQPLRIADGGLELEPLKLTPERGPDGTLTKLVPTPLNPKTRAVADCLLGVIRELEQTADAGVLRSP